MKITVDTNVLVRAAVRDHPKQTAAATRLLRNADVVAVTLPSLCEFVWVLDSVYKFSRQETAVAIEALCNSANVALDRPAVDAGLAVLKAGGDFADGVIAYEGRWLGGETFVSFDKKAVSLIVRQRLKAKLLA
jgi:predicted nucleic-acid-binding protein